MKPVVCPQRRARETSRSEEIETRSFREEAVKHDRETPLYAVTQVTRMEHSKHVSLMTARISMLKMKPIMIER